MDFCTDDEYERFMRVAPFVEREIIENGIILLKYFLDVSQDEQRRRFEARLTDPVKHWKLSPMDLKSYTRWYDYSRARDAMFAATDTAESPWYVVDSNDKRRARLNLITHLLNHVPYEEVPRKHVKFPKRGGPGDYKEPDYPYRIVPEIY